MDDARHAAAARRLAFRCHSRLRSLFLPPSPLRRVPLELAVCLMDAVVYRQYSGESELPHIMALVQHELSEPYVIYTYRYFLQQW